MCTSKEPDRKGTPVGKSNFQQAELKLLLRFQKVLQYNAVGGRSILRLNKWSVLMGPEYSTLEMFPFSRREQAGINLQTFYSSAPYVQPYGIIIGSVIWLRMGSIGTLLRTRQWASGFHGNKNFLDQLSPYNISEKKPIPQGKCDTCLGITFPFTASYRIEIWCLKFECGACHIKTGH